MKALGERLVVVCVSAIFAAITLLLYPIALFFFGLPAAGGGTFLLGAAIYALVFSRIGLLVIIVSATVGLFAGRERMADIFSVFWGTHSLWQRVRDHLEEDESRFKQSNLLWLLAILLFTLLAITCVVTKFLT